MKSLSSSLCSLCAGLYAFGAGLCQRIVSSRSIPWLGSALFGMLGESSLLAEERTLQTDHALAIHIPTGGLHTIGEALARRLPASIPVTAGSGVLNCDSSSSLQYTMGDWDLSLVVDEMEFVTVQGRLELMVYGHLQSSETTMDMNGDCAILENLQETCSLEIGTTPFSLNLGLDFALSDDGLSLETVVSEPVFELAPVTNPIQNCIFGDAVETILGQNPYMLSDLIMGLIEPELGSVTESIQGAFDGVIDQLIVEQDVDLLGSNVHLRLAPTVFTVEDSGIVLGLGSYITVDVDPSCSNMAEYPIETGVNGVDVDWPTFDGRVFTTGIPYDLGFFVGKHFVDQALYAVWVSGALCIDVAEMSGLSITGELASGFFGEEIQTLVGEDTIELQLFPRRPFQAEFSDDQPPISIAIDGLMLESYADILHRRSRILSVNIGADVGVIMSLDANRVSMEIPLDAEAFFLQEEYHEMLPHGYSEGVPNLLDLALGSVLGNGTLPVLVLPSVFGMNLDTIIWQPDSTGAWLGGHLIFDPDSVQPSIIAGCSASDFGCDSGGPSIDIDVNTLIGCDDMSIGCEGGCSQPGTIKLPVGRMLGLCVIILGAMIRRRE